MTAYLFNAAPICTTPSEAHRQIVRELPPHSKASEIKKLDVGSKTTYQHSIKGKGFVCQDSQDLTLASA